MTESAASAADVKTEGVNDKDFGPAFDKLYDLMDEDRMDECLEEARDLTSGRAPPTYLPSHQDLDSARECHPAGVSAKTDEIYDELAEFLQDLRNGLDNEEDEISLREAPPARSKLSVENMETKETFASEPRPERETATPNKPYVPPFKRNLLNQEGSGDRTEDILQCMVPCARCPATFPDKAAHERHQTVCAITVAKQVSAQIVAERKNAEKAQALLRDDLRRTIKVMSEENLAISKEKLAIERTSLATQLRDLEKVKANIAIERKVIADKLADLEKSNTQVTADSEQVSLSLSKLDSELAEMSD
ncbi:UbiE, Methylase protein [Pyrenophora tritici-repentis]|nr:UbiE, Methylase protein [Pyrenophora tritici-repentis]